MYLREMREEESVEEYSEEEVVEDTESRQRRGTNLNCNDNPATISTKSTTYSQHPQHPQPTRPQHIHCPQRPQLVCACSCKMTYYWCVVDVCFVFTLFQM